MKIVIPPGATPLTLEDLEGLRIFSVTTQGDLNLAEEDNIKKGRLWAKNSKKIKSSLLEWPSLSLLHRKMFGDVWNWAGNKRIRETTIGVNPSQIFEEIRKLEDDAKFWIADKTFTSEIIAVRFHHRLVKIHPFRNGNGRFSRFASELLVKQLNGRSPTFGGEFLNSNTDGRKDYISALQQADAGNYAPLIEFSYRE